MIELPQTPLLFYHQENLNFYSSQEELQNEIEESEQNLENKKDQNFLNADFFALNRRISTLYLNRLVLTQTNNPQLAEESCKKALYHIKQICTHKSSSDTNVMTALLDISVYRLFRVQKSWEQIMPISLHKKLRFLTKGSCEIEKALRIQETTFGLEQKRLYKKEMAKMWIRLEDELKSDFLDGDEDAYPTGTIRLDSIYIKSEKDKQAFLNAIKILSDNPEDPEATNILISLTPDREKQRLQLNICKYMEPHPEFLINYIKNCTLQTIPKVSFRIPALEKLKKIVDQKLKLVEEKYAQVVNTADVVNEANSLVSRSQSLNEQIERAKKNEKIEKDKWQKDLIKLLSVENISKNIFENHETAFWRELKSIHQRHPECALPFLHLLFYEALLPLDGYRYLLKNAYACDPYKTYTISLAIISTWKERKNSWPCLSTEQEKLDVLRSFYPKDLILSNKMEDGPCVVFEDLHRIEPFRSLALQQLASGQIDESIHTLIEIKQLINGFAFPHQYLALAWALKGDASKAFKLLERASVCCLPDISVSYSSSIAQINLDVPEIPPSLLHSLIDCITQDFNLLLIKNLIDHCQKSFQENKLEELPFIYFSLQWLITHTVPLEFEVYKDIWENLFKLISLCADLNHRTGDGVSDAWIAEHFSRIEKPLNLTDNPQNDMIEFQYTVSFPIISWGLVTEEEIPPFVFQNLKLTKYSVHLISANLTKKIYGFLSGMICQNHSKFFLEQEIQILPDYPTLFIAELQIGFSHKPNSHQHQCAIRLLDLYSSKEAEQRPYTISEDILNWADWNKSCYEDYNSYLKSGDPRLTFLKKSNHSELLENVNIAMFDVMKAEESLKNRLAFDSSYPLSFEGSSLYEVFELSQKLFGWRLNETFENWGDRLTNKEKIFHNGIFDNGGFQNESNSTHSSIEFSLSGGNTLKAVRGFLEFWQRFHERVSCKNQWIAQDGEESSMELNGSKSSENSKWRPEVDEKTWQKIIEKNEPREYPSKLKKPKDFETLVKNKHAHACEIKQLKDNYEQLIKTQVNKQDKARNFPTIIAATMHINAEYSRSERTHSVYVKTKESAEFIYRLILEITTERLVQKICREKGHFGWALTDTNQTFAALLAALEPSKDHFHGPERHWTGDAPFHWHYNAYIYNAAGKFINFHIYYDH